MRTGLRTPASPARQPDRPQVPEPLRRPAAVAEEQQLATPDGGVAAVAGAVEDQPEEGLVEPAVLGGERGEVGVVVLHLVHRHAQLGGEPACPRP